MRFLIKNTTEYRLETIEEVEAFHKKLQERAIAGGYTLTNFSWAEKFVKEKQEIVDSYFQVKCTFVYNELKMPENSWYDVEATGDIDLVGEE